MPHYLIVERIQQRLLSSSYYAIRKISVTIINGSITLTGEVPRFYDRQQAIAIAKAHTHLIVNKEPNAPLLTDNIAVSF